MLRKFFLHWESYAGMEQGRLLRLITSKSAGSTPASATNFSAITDQTIH
ncbi:hypothetical protein APA_3974 [Pseudanabaena sp. lw0831]|nr:hypothetical protein APA_3974 [Pseudanabaena sp. lw0831]